MDADPLAWWKFENSHFPNLALLVRKYLSICGTSVPSERKFSLSGHICNNSRNRLLPESVNKLVFLDNISYFSPITQSSLIFVDLNNCQFIIF